MGFEQPQVSACSPLFSSYGRFCCSLIGTFTILGSESVKVCELSANILCISKAVNKHQE